MTNCKTCKHWDINSSVSKDVGSGFGLCRRVSFDRDHDDSKELATAICYGEGIEGQLITKPDFACILGEVI